MVQVQVRINEKASQIIAPQALLTGELDINIELLGLNGTKPEADTARKIVEKLSFWLNKPKPE